MSTDPLHALEDSYERMVAVQRNFEGQIGMIESRVGRQLRATRQELGISLGELALRTRLTKGFLSKIEGGSRRLSAKTLTKIIVALRKSK